MKLTVKEFENQLAIVKTTSGSVRQNLLASLKSAEVVDESGNIVSVKMDIEPEVETKSIEAEVKSIVAAEVEAVKVSNPVNKVYAQPKKYYNLKAFDNAEDAYMSGKFIQGYLFGDMEARQFCINKGITSKATTGTTIGAGGALVPDLMEAAIVRNVDLFGIRPWIRNRVMSSDTLIVPLQTGGMTAAYFGQNVAITESDATFNQATLVAKKLGILHLISSEISEDAIIDVADTLVQSMSEAFGAAEEDAFWNGDGTSTYGTITGLVTALNDGNHAGSVVTTISGNVSYDTLDREDFVKAMARLPRYAQPNAKWYISSPAYYDSMARLEYAAGGNSKSDIEGGTGVQFMGKPVVFQDKLPTTLTTLAGLPALVYGDLDRSSLFGSRRGFTVKSDGGLGVNMNKDVTTILATERYDVVHHGLGTASVAGPAVLLKFV